MNSTGVEFRTRNIFQKNLFNRTISNVLRNIESNIGATTYLLNKTDLHKSYFLATLVNFALNRMHFLESLHLIITTTPGVSKRSVQNVTILKLWFKRYKILRIRNTSHFSISVVATALVWENFRVVNIAMYLL